MTNDATINSKPLHEVLPIVKGQCELFMKDPSSVMVPFLAGKPGGGKTESIREEFSDFGIFSLHLAYHPIEEISGIPLVQKISFNNEEYDGTKWTLPDIISEIYRMANEYEKVLLFIDDFHLCSPALMNYGYQLFTEKRIRNYELPKNCTILLAGNYSTKSGAKSISSGVTNRCSIYFVHTDYEYWKEHFAIPNGINYKILGFLDNTKYNSYFHEDETINKPWGSPRSWTKFSRLINELEDAIGTIDNDMLLYLAQAHISVEAASKFAIEYNIFSKIDTKHIFDTDEIKLDNVNVYSYGKACLNEFYNRLKNKDGKHFKTMAKILVMIAKNNFELTISLLKDIILNEKIFKRKNLFETIINTINDIDSNLKERMLSILSRI